MHPRPTDRGDHRIRPIDRGHSEGGCGDGRGPFPRREADEVAADGADRHRHRQPGEHPGHQIGGHGRLTVMAQPLQWA